MQRGPTAIDVVRHGDNDTNFAYEVRRLDEESPVEYAITRRWLDRWIAAGAVVADIGVGVGHYALHLARRACQIHLVDIAVRLLQTAQVRLRDTGPQAAVCGVTMASATDLSSSPPIRLTPCCCSGLSITSTLWGIDNGPCGKPTSC